MVKKCESIGSEVKPLIGAREAIEKLVENHRVVIVTARPEKFKNKTHDWLKLNFPMLNEVIFLRKDYNSHSKNKGEICREIGADIMIDDNLDNVINCADNGVSSILVDYPWNRGAQLHESIERASSWEHIMSIIEGMELKQGSLK